MTDTTGANGADTTRELASMRVPDLQALAAELGIRGAARLRKGELVEAITAARGEAEADADAAAAAEPDAVESVAATEAGPTDSHAETEAPVAEAPAAEPQSDDDPIAAAIFPDERRAAADASTNEQAPLSLDDLVLPPARGDEEPEPRGRRRRRVAVAEGAPADGASSDDAEQEGDDTESRDEQGDAGDGERQGGRRRGRGRGRRGRQQDQQDGESEDDNDGDDEQDSSQEARGRGRGRQRDEQSQDGDDEGRRGRGRFRDRKRGRGDDVDPEYAPDDVLLPIAGILDVLDNYAFVRTSGYLPGPNDVYVSLGQVKKYGLRKGDAIVGAVRQPREGEQQHGRQKFNAIVKFDSVNGQTPDEAASRPDFDDLTPLYPDERLRLETESGRLTQRMIDLFAPIGKGTRGLIVAPPKAGKSVVLQQIANAIAENSPSTHLMFVLVDERPEEVTNMRRTIQGEVVASTFDLPAEDHTTIADLAIERAKRLVELGHDVVVLLDSITALCRAYNLSAPASGRIIAGGVDASALYPPKRIFGAARNIENGGSLTILATAMVETGSRTDEVILEEFIGKGNMELRLSREIADRRIFPAIDLQHSMTMQEEQLLDPAEVDVTWRIRRDLTSDQPQASLEAVLDRMASTSSNAEFLAEARQRPIGQEPAGNRR